MIRQFRSLFSRYADLKNRMAGQGTQLLRPDQTAFGQVERMAVRNGRLVLEGWADAHRVTLAQDGVQVQTRPDLLRDDVTQTLGTLRNPRPGFLISLPYRAGPVSLMLESGTDVQSFTIPAFDPVKVRKVRRRHLVSFVGLAVLALPLVVRYKLSSDPVRMAQLRQKIKRRLDLHRDDASPTSTVLDARLIADTDAPPSTPADMNDSAITIVLPIYNAFDLVQECLERVQRYTDLHWHLVVIEDCSTDMAVRPWLADWVTKTNAATPGRVTLIENAQNRGFIGSVNSGFEVALTRGDHVVLLNSDALMPDAWASRLIQPLLTEPNAASVTPMSNDAEIFGAPVMCVPVTLSPGEGDLIDRTAATFTGDGCVIEAPTGVGFCMAMHIDALRRYPQFDTTFGRGYGEEVDWCQKVRADGGRHLGLASLYVEHRGGQSFGSAAKLELIARNNGVIANRYERYDAEVQDFITHDPLYTPRLALALAWVAARADGQGHALPVYMAHDLGGGAEHYLQRRIADDMAAGGTDRADVAVVLRVGGPWRFQIEVHSTVGVTKGATDDFSVVQQLLKPAQALHLVYSNGVGDPDPVALPGFLLDLKRTEKDSIEVLFHDFFPLSPSYTLLDQNNRFEGVPAASLRNRAHETRRPDGTQVTLADWRAAWGALIAAAEDVVVFAQDSFDHVRAAYPQANPTVLRHTLGHTPDLIAAPETDGAPVIGVLGNIGAQKGANVLVQLGAQVAPKGLVVIGNVDPAFDVGPHTIVHGDYDLTDIEALALKYRISGWLIPSIWPETFSYTIHECLATGLPVWCFDLGAQAEALKRAVDHGARGGVLPLDWIDEPQKILHRLTVLETA
ncbi:MAG: glycosyltransferase family 2 protein [Octadecabacter sp.]